MTGLDPQSSLVIDVRRLHRTPGSMLELELDIPAPADLGVAMARVLEGSPIAMYVRLESVLEGVLVSGSADLEVTAECSRCLDPISWRQETEFTELFRYPTTDARGSVVDADDEVEDPLPVLEDDTLDLEPVLRDAVVLDLPLAPLCREDCLGLCPQCGVRLEDDAQHAHDTTDPRWAALAALTEPDVR